MPQLIVGCSAATGPPAVKPGEKVPAEGVLPLNRLRDCDGARKRARRVGRGIGCGRGKTCGRGHKGQNARAGRGPGPFFEGGQTELHQRIPKKHSIRQIATNSSRKHQPEFVTVDMLRAALSRGAIPSASSVVDMKALVEAGLVNKKRARRYGVHLAAYTTRENSGSSSDSHCPIQLELTAYSDEAKKQLERAGGKVTSAYYNELGRRALIQPHKFTTGLPRPAWPPQRLRCKYDKVGELGGRGPRGSEFGFSLMNSSGNE